jgi:hypothetical protein
MVEEIIEAIKQCKEYEDERKKHILDAKKKNLEIH